MMVDEPKSGNENLRATGQGPPAADAPTHPGGFEAPPSPPGWSGPPPPGAGPLSADVNTNLPLVLSIASVFCCTTSTIGGLVGLVLSLQARNLRGQGDLDGARAKAKLALVIAIVGFAA